MNSDHLFNIFGALLRVNDGAAKRRQRPAYRPQGTPGGGGSGAQPATGYSSSTASGARAPAITPCGVCVAKR